MLSNTSIAEVASKEVIRDQIWSELQRKFEGNEVLVVTVTGVVKGGLSVDLGVRGFIPASHVELHFIKDFSSYKGRSLQCKIIEIDPSKNKLVLSNRVVMEEELELKKKGIIDTLNEGQVLEGTVQRIIDFGVFVDLGGIDGLIHVSELSWNHVGHPSEIVNEGEKISVKIVRLDKEKGRVSLSLREMTTKPWEYAFSQIQVGEVLEGRVKKLTSFGAFVELFPGVEGLVHISQISIEHIEAPGDVLEEGQQVRVKVLGVDLEDRRVGLSIKDVEKEPSNQEKMQNLSSSQSELSFTLGDVFPELKNLK